MRQAVAAGLVALAALIGLAEPVDARERRGDVPGRFDFYVLALSWSPGYCALEGGPRDSAQCDPGRGLGFVVHGLWPQFERGYPTACAPAERTPSRIALEEARGVFPSEDLARHEWRRHGTCSGLDPAAYFRATRTARDRVVVPARFVRLDGDIRLTPNAIERAFVEANPGLTSEGVAAICRRGLLQEVRLCLARDLRGFIACPEVDRAGCRGGPTTVNAAP